MPARGGRHGARGRGGGAGGQHRGGSGRGRGRGRGGGRHQASGRGGGGGQHRGYSGRGGRAAAVQGHGGSQRGAGSSGHRRGSRGGGHAGSRANEGGRRSSSSISVPALEDFCSLRGTQVFDGSTLAAGSRHDASLAAIPLKFESPMKYLTTMQAHTEAEFAAAVEKGLEACGRAEGGGWRACRRLDGLDALAVAESGDWTEEPWIFHAVQLEGVAGVCLSMVSGTVESVAPECPADICTKLRRSPTGEADKQEGYIVLRGVDREQLGCCRRLRSLGFMGSFMLEYESAHVLRQQLAARSFTPQHAALLHKVSAPGKRGAQRGGCGFLQPPSAVDEVLLEGTANASQRSAIRSVQDGLSIIHGPPGTGKSTTILYLIQSRTRPGSKVLVTCTRNQAINAVAEKLSGMQGGILAFGNERSLREDARRYTLRQRTIDDPCTRGFEDVVVGQCPEAKQQGLGVRERLALSSSLRRWLARAEQHVSDHGDVYRSVTGIQPLLAKARGQGWQTMEEAELNAWLAGLHSDLAHLCAEVRAAVRARILREARVYICTIDSTPRLMLELEEATTGEAAGRRSAAVASAKPPVEIETVIVDEAGCVLESAVPILLRWAPSNLVLLGDHLQLAPYTSLDPQHPLARDGTHARSLMQRAVQAGCDAPMLQTQYRMHPAIRQPISTLFYGGALLDADGLASRRSTLGFAPLASGGPARWVDCKEPETPHDRRGYSNEGEADLVLRVLRWVRTRLQASKGGRKQQQQPTVFIITFYNAQRREIDRRLQEEYGAGYDGSVATLVTVDSVQGSEADIVILSTVRSQSHKQDLGLFMKDEQRLCVAFSRARELSLVVGNRGELMSKGGRVWRTLVQAYRAVEAP